jgi:cysteine desulfurase
MEKIYFDHNATTQMHPMVLEAMLPYLREQYGNPSSLHWLGQAARRALDRAREQVADLINAFPDEIVFTSGGTEADNQALIGISDYFGAPYNRIITTSIEHQAVLSTCRHLEEKGFRLDFLPVDREGRIDLKQLEELLDDEVILISIMFANNEVGTVQPIVEAAAIARERGILFHTDAVQAGGKIPIDVCELGVDLLSLSGHKINGPKGSGALFVSRGMQAPVLLRGGHHERQRRAGTENVPAIVGFGEACRLAKRDLVENSRKMTLLRDRFEEGILRSVPEVLINSCCAQRLPNTVNVSFSGVDAQLLAMNLDLMGVAVSTGSACQAESREPSYVLLAMGRDHDEASNCLRFSFGPENTADEADQVVAILAKLVGELREHEPA